eukprot:TRINITY_DN8912_c0_g1_i1.p1 TRINITY_DN8912_c0_g1~~TRINITY_DN8912_c0_g1_i1.p1  ORF type:complete len:400 (-),score=117.30 TRINITY_DN8912_c0_g1_i1:60-1202(-)
MCIRDRYMGTVTRHQDELNKLYREKAEFEELLCEKVDQESQEVTKIQELEAKIVAQNTEIANHSAIDEQRKQQIERMKIALKELQEEFRQEREKRKATSEINESLREEFQVENEKLKEEITALREKEASLIREVEAKNSEIERLCSDGAISERWEFGEQVRKLNEEMEARRKDYQEYCEMLCVQYILFGFEIERLHQVKSELVSLAKSIGDENVSLGEELKTVKEELLLFTETLEKSEQEKSLLKEEIERLKVNFEEQTRKNETSINELITQKDLYAEQLEVMDRETFMCVFLIGVELERLSMINDTISPEIQLVERDSIFNRRNTDPAAIDPEQQMLSQKKSISVEEKLLHLQESLRRFEKSLLQTNKGKYSPLSLIHI